MTRLRAVSSLVTCQLLPLPSVSAGDGVARPALVKIQLQCHKHGRLRVPAPVLLLTEKQDRKTGGCFGRLEGEQSDGDHQGVTKQESSKGEGCFYAPASFAVHKATLSKTRPALTLLNQYREVEPGTKRLPRQEGCSQPRHWQKPSRASKRAARLILI